LTCAICVCTAVKSFKLAEIFSAESAIDIFKRLFIFNAAKAWAAVIGRGLAVAARLATLTDVTCMIYPLNVIKAARDFRSSLVSPSFDR
jgi:hypothetical protein